MRSASIIIANFNYGRYIAEAIASSLAQSYSETEVIVVDDGSTDSSRDVINSFGGRVKPIFRGNNGQASAWNAGFAVSRGDTIIFLDSDDILLPTAVESAAALLASPDISKVHWPLWLIDADGVRLPGRRPQDPLPEGDFCHTVLSKGAHSFTNPPTAGAAWARSFLENVLPMPEQEFRTGADAYLTYTAPLFGLIAAIQTPQALYRRHRQSDSTKSLQAHIQDGVRWDLECCKAIYEFARRAKLELGPAFWSRDTYFHKVSDLVSDILPFVCRDRRFILVDDHQIWLTDLVPESAYSLFMERDGVWEGYPPDDDEAISTLYRLRAQGHTHLVIPWGSFWFLEVYPYFAAVVRQRFACKLANDRIIVFDLGTETPS